MHRTQIEIYSNLEAYVCHDNKSNFSNEKKTYFSSKPVSKFVAFFRLRCLPARKRRKVSLNIGELRCFCLLFSANERIAVGNSSRAAFYLFVVARVGDAFPQFLWSKQLARSCWSASIRANISLNTFLQVHDVSVGEKRRQKLVQNSSA